MKILHITTSIDGGAGIAALRSHIALCDIGIESRLLCLGSQSTHHASVYNHPYYIPPLIKRVAHKIGINACTIYKQISISKTMHSLGLEIFSLPYSDYTLHNHPLVKWADIIHLHWVAGFIDYPSFFANVQKPVVWTLHDMNPFLGGLHYRDEDKNKIKTIRLHESRLVKLKSNLLQRHPSIHLICPSRWICSLSRISPAFSKNPHFVIPNTLDINKYSLIDKLDARNKLSLPKDKTLLLFSAASVMNKRKGFDLLLDALSIMPEFIKNNLGLCVLGSTTPIVNTNIQTYFLGKITNEDVLNCAYCAADAFAITSREDNLPNVIIESLICGTPVIGTPVGGIPEMIQADLNGILCSSTSTSDIASAIESFIHHKSIFNPSCIRNDAIALYNPQTHAIALVNLYSNICKR